MSTLTEGPVRELAGVKKILLMKVCCLGDVLFTTPVIRALRRDFASAEIHYLVGRWSRGVLDDNPHLSRVIEFPDRKASLPLFVGRLRGERYDLSINFHRSWTTHAFLRAAGASRRAGFAWGRGRTLLTDSTPFDPKAHEVRRYLSIVREMGLSTDSEFTEMFVTPSQRSSAREILRRAGLDPARKTAVLLPGGGRNPGTVLMAKRWTPQGFRDLARWLIQVKGLQVAAAGALDDVDAARAALEGVEGPAACVAGKTSLAELKGLLAEASYVVGNDSGPTHMAAALQTPTLMIFGPSDPRLVGPLGSRHETVWGRPACSPCYAPETVFEKNFKNCRTWECTQTLGSETVLSAAAAHWDRLASAA